MITGYTWEYIIDPSSVKYCLRGWLFALVLGLNTFGLLQQDVVK